MSLDALALVEGARAVYERGAAELARVEVEKVLESLLESGYYVQLPPELPVEEEISRYLS